MVQHSHSYMATGKTKALTIQTFVGKVISLLFNTMSRFVIAFLPRSKNLLISWPQSLSTVILKNISSCYYYHVPGTVPSVGSKDDKIQHLLERYLPSSGGNTHNGCPMGRQQMERGKPSNLNVDEGQGEQRTPPSPPPTAPELSSRVQRRKS